MSFRLQRFAKRKAAWLEAAAGKISLHELQATEFKHKNGGPDLYPSVYLIEEDHAYMVRAYAEHVAAAPIDPPKMTIAVDTSDLSAATRETPGNAKFSFIQSRHRELCFANVEMLLLLVEQVLAAFESRHEGITKAEVVEYARGRAACGDQEWVAVIHSDEGQTKAWLRALLQPSHAR